MTFTLVPNKTLTVVTSDHKVKTIQSSHVNWAKIMDALKTKNESLVVSLMDVKQAVETFGNDLTYRGDIEVKGESVFYRGEKLFGRDVDNLFAFLKDGIPADGLVRFLERKFGNVSKRSIESLYGFLQHGNMPITPNGTFLGYKGVKNDYNSKNTGSEPLLKGIRNADGSINNSVGQTILVDRRYVCDDFNNACAAGLHVGSLQYAKGWAGESGRVVIVEVDPANVVTVPNSETEKLRCCGYTVVGEFSGPLPNEFTNQYEVNSPSTDENVTCEDCGNNINDCVCELCEDCGNPADNCDCDFQEGNCGCSNGTCAACSNVEETESVGDEYDNGFVAGQADGRAHKRRLYTLEDASDARRKNPKYIVGYNDGYKKGRNGK